MASLRSLLLVEEKLLEAEYFLNRLHFLSFAEFGYELNAFLSAARSVTFLLQKEMRSVSGFDEWWRDRVAEMRNDPSMEFFKESRNFSQKEGRVSVSGWSGLFAGGAMSMSYRFAPYGNSVPGQLTGRDVIEFSREHLGKLATIVLACAEEFPLHCCPRRAVTVEGLKELSLDLSDIEQMLGFPRGWTDFPDVPHEERLRFLQQQFDGVDFERIRAIAKGDPNHKPTDVRRALGDASV